MAAADVAARGRRSMLLATRRRDDIMLTGPAAQHRFPELIARHQRASCAYRRHDDGRHDRSACFGTPAAPPPASFHFIYTRALGVTYYRAEAPDSFMKAAFRFDAAMPFSPFSHERALHFSQQRDFRHFAPSSGLLGAAYLRHARCMILLPMMLASHAET